MKPVNFDEKYNSELSIVAATVKRNNKTLGGITVLLLLLFVGVSVSVGVLVYKQNKQERFSKQGRVQIQAAQIDLNYVYLRQQTIERKIDSLSRLLFNTVLSSTQADFQSSIENKKVLNKINVFVKEQTKIKQLIKTAKTRKSNDFYFSKSQKGKNRKLTPVEFIKAYQVAFDLLFDKFNITKPNTKTYNLTLSVSTAQGILESGWGGSNLAYNFQNWHGIKCQACGGTFVFGKCTDINSVKFNDDCEFDRFYIYTNLTESIAAHYMLIFENNNRYTKAYKLALTKPTLESFNSDGKISNEEFWASDVGTLCRGIDKAGYATEDNYHLILKTLILKYHIY